MNFGQFRTYIISLFLVFAICGAGVANTWNFSDHHNGQLLHIDHADPHGSDMDDFKHKLVILPSIAPRPYLLPLPELLCSKLAPTAVQLIHPLSSPALSLPSRASPV